MVDDKIIELSDSERLDWLRLIRTKNIGPVTFDQLVSKYGSVKEAIKIVPELSVRGGKEKATTIFSKKDAEKEIESLTKLNGRIIAKCEKEYPELLKYISDAPPVISVIGNVDLLSKKAVSIVGARNASINGKKLTQKIAKELGEEGIIIVSGLARGIDTAAHIGALDTGTIAVVAGGIDIIYPKENIDLYKKISETSVIIAECPLGTTPRPENFPRRNRIVSGVSTATLIVEAAKRSGSLNTARHANEQGRDVMAIPGSPVDPRAEGPNILIKNGAYLVTSAEDIMEIIFSQSENIFTLSESKQKTFSSANIARNIEGDVEKFREKITDILNYNPISIDDIIIETHANINIVLTVVLELEIAGKLQRHPGNKISLLF